MLKEKVLAGVGIEAPAEKEKHTGLGTARIMTVLGFVLLGLILPRGNIYGVTAPFGVSLVASVDGVGSMLVYIAALVGYLLSGEMSMPLRYMAAVAVAGAVHWTCGVLPHIRHSKLFAPLLACGATWASGFLMGGAGSFLGVLLTLAEGIAAGGFAYFFKEAFLFLVKTRRRTGMTLPEQTGFVLIGAAALLAIFPLEYYYISFGRLAANVFILLFARAGREQSGAAAGTILGVALMLSMPERPYAAVGFAFGGLLAGVFSRYGRFAVAGVYLIANVLLCLTSVADLSAAACIYETVAACIVFTLLPRSLDKLLRRFLMSGQHLPAVEGLRRSMTMKLDVAATAMHQVAGTVDAVSEKLARYGAPEIGGVYRRVEDTVCRHCSLHTMCWDKQATETLQTLHLLTPVLREKGEVHTDDFAGTFTRTCRRPHDVAQTINREYDRFLEKESAWERLHEVRAVVTAQFKDTGDLLDEIGARFHGEQRVDTETANRVVALCEDFGMPVEEAVCLVSSDDRLTVEILAEDVGVCVDGGRWFREMEICCGREFARPAVLEMQGMVKITLTEKPQYRVTVGVAQHTCTGEKLIGDVCEQYEDGGRAVFILSDGMGSGGRAAVDGALAAGISAKLMRAGFSPDTVLKTVNTALLAKSGDETLTTLDIMETDLFTGKVTLYKAGAVTSLLKSGGRVSRMEAPSLPVGILQNTGFETVR
ncbi:MAG: SpoIIE family protein phosphatase, partial [Clostridia bacterium]|nr:SpoIIE family protein phosphatase [Clostridia bacterium]